MKTWQRRFAGLLAVSLTSFVPTLAPADEAPVALPTLPGEAPTLGNIGIRVGGAGGEFDAALGLSPPGAGVIAPDVYVVQPGDTLWDLCGYFFANPYLWPKIWSYNPIITNPHWIYPGDVIRLSAEGEPGPVDLEPGPAPLGPKVVAVPATVFLRRHAFVTDKEYTKHGVITAAIDDKYMLSIFDTIYLRFPKGSVPGIHDRLTLYDRTDAEKIKGAKKGRPKRAAALGSLVNIGGTAEVTRVLEDDRTVTAIITEALLPIERGHRAGPVTTAFKLVAPVRNHKELEGRVVEAIGDEEIVGLANIVIVDRGADAGVKEGNRFLVLRRGDGLPGPAEARIEKEDRKRTDLPYEAIGELLVVETKAKTSTCFVTRSTRDVQIGDKVLMRKGY